jgi:hypothetical protein
VAALDQRRADLGKHGQRHRLKLHARQRRCGREAARHRHRVQPALSYQWQDCNAQGHNCTAIRGATGVSDTLQKSDEGFTVIFTVTAANPDASVSASSKPTALVSASAPVNTTPPTIVGTAKRTNTLTGTQRNWTGAGNTYAYQWEDCDANGQNCAAIKGATGTGYTLQSSDERDTVIFAVTATNPDASVTATAKPTAAVAAMPSLSTHAPVISGTAQQGQLLSMSRADLERARWHHLHVSMGAV